MPLETKLIIVEDYAVNVLLYKAELAEMISQYSEVVVLASLDEALQAVASWSTEFAYVILLDDDLGNAGDGKVVLDAIPALPHRLVLGMSSSKRQAEYLHDPDQYVGRLDMDKAKELMARFLVSLSA